MRRNNAKKKKRNPLKIILLTLILIVLIFLSSVYILKNFFYPTKHFDIIKSESSKNNIDPYLILSIIKTESGFNQNAISNKKAKGLMQIMDSTAKEINNNINVTDTIDDNIYNIDINIALGCKYFSTLINKYSGNYYLAICAYNAGMGNVDKWIEQGLISDKLDEHKNVKDIPFPQTRNYLNKVVSTYEMYRLLYR